MRILDIESDKPINQIAIYLTFSELKELNDSIVSLLENNFHHAHISGEDYQKEITICNYEANSIESFDERSKRLIADDT